MWKVVIAVMLIFGAGVVTGGLLVRARVAPQVAPTQTQVTGVPANTTPTPASVAAPGRQVFIQRVRRELDLTPEQSAQVDEIMRDSHKRMQKLYEPLSPQAREETRRVRQEIQAILTPSQKKAFNEKFKRRQQTQRSETNATAQIKD